jgi:hypothetical protein
MECPMRSMLGMTWENSSSLRRNRGRVQRRVRRDQHPRRVVDGSSSGGRAAAKSTTFSCDRWDVGVPPARIELAHAV